MMLLELLLEIAHEKSYDEEEEAAVQAQEAAMAAKLAAEDGHKSKGRRRSTTTTSTKSPMKSPSPGHTGLTPHSSHHHSSGHHGSPGGGGSSERSNMHLVSLDMARAEEEREREEERVSAAFVRSLWSEVVEMLSGMKASGMHRARWSDLMAGWNGVHRSKRGGATTLTEDYPAAAAAANATAAAAAAAAGNNGMGGGDFLLDQEAGLEGKVAITKEFETLIRATPGEVDGAGGGDDEVEKQTNERRWIRLQAARMLFESCVSQKNMTDDEAELSMLEVDVFDFTTGVADVSELRAFMRGVVRTQKFMSLRHVINRLESKLVEDLDGHGRLDGHGLVEEHGATTEEWSSSSASHPTSPTSGGGEPSSGGGGASSSGAPLPNQDDPAFTLEDNDEYLVHDHLYYYARSIHRASMELSIAIESSDVWREVCGLYNKMSRDSTLTFSDFLWVADHAYRLRVGSFRRSAYHVRQAGNTESNIGEVVGATQMYSCLTHGFASHYCSDGRCRGCEMEATSVEPLRFEMYRQWKEEMDAEKKIAEKEEKEKKARRKKEKREKSRSNSEESGVSGSSISATRLRDARNEAKSSVKKSRQQDERQRRRGGIMSTKTSRSSSSSDGTPRDNSNSLSEEEEEHRRDDTRNDTRSDTQSDTRSEMLLVLGEGENQEHDPWSSEEKKYLNRNARIKKLEQKNNVTSNDDNDNDNDDGEEKKRRKNNRQRGERGGELFHQEEKMKRKWSQRVEEKRNRRPQSAGSGTIKKEKTRRRRQLKPDVEELDVINDPTIEIVTTDQEKFSRPRSGVSGGIGMRPTSAPHRRRDPLRQSKSNEKFHQHYKGQSLEAQQKARDIAAKRIAALEGSGRNQTFVQHSDAMLQRTSRLREQLEKSNKVSVQANKEIESHLRSVRKAMEKEIRASLLNNRKAARSLAAKQSQVGLSKKSSMQRKRGGSSRGQRVEEDEDRQQQQQRQRSPDRATSSGSGNNSRPLHEEQYMSSILAEEQQKIMSKVKKLIMSEYNMNQETSMMKTIDPTVLQPMMRSALIKYARQGDLDAVRDLLDGGVDPDTRLVEHPCRTLLQEAARTGRAALAELLVKNGASIAFKDEDGFNALYHAYNSGHGGLAERLVSTQMRRK